MTLTSNNSLYGQGVAGHILPAPAAEGGEDTAEALALNPVAPNPDWSYSATAEGRTGEVAGDTGHDMDGEPGLTYDGPAGNSLFVTVKGLDVSTGLNNAPEATDEYTAAIYRNNDLVGHADEGWVSELDTGTAEFNISTTIPNMQVGDVVRVVLLSHEGNEAGIDLDVADSGVLYVG